MTTSPLIMMSFEELVIHIKQQHPDMKQSAIEEIAESILEEASTVYVFG
jgi:hypothetical protein